MAEGVREQAVAFAAEHLKKNPEITMGELKKLAGPKKINIYPLIIGYAKSRLGMGKKKARGGRRKKAGRRAVGRPPGRRGPGRPPKSVDPTAALHGIVAHMRDLEREVGALRSALAKIGDLAAGT